MITARYHPDGTIGFNTRIGDCAPAGWWCDYPRLALYIAGMNDENSAVPMVPEELMATDEEAKKAEEILAEYPASTVFAIGYYDMQPNGFEPGSWLPNVIAGRYC